MRTLFDWLVRDGGRWDTCVFEQLREDSPLLRTPVPSGWGERTESWEANDTRHHRRTVWHAPETKV